MTREDRIKGVLLGQAAGDALGAGYEYTGHAPLRGQAGMVGGGFGFEPGEWTDDTQQAIIVAMSRSDPLGVAEGLLAWYAGGPRDVGTTTRAALSGARDAADLPDAAVRSRTRTGHGMYISNGSLMRTGPVCLPFLGDSTSIVTAAREISDLTHASPYAGDACVLWSLAISRAVALGSDFGLETTLLTAVNYLPSARRESWRLRIRAVLDSRAWPSGFKPNGEAINAFSAALSAAGHAESLEDGLQWAVSAGGDTDTVAAIAGALLGAIHGASAVPERWRKALHGWPGMDANDLERIALEATF